MVKAGELGGVLEIVLNRLAEYQEKAQKLKNKIVAAMVYPIIVMFIAVAIMIFLMLVIVPKFEKIFEDMLGSKDKLPEITKVGHRLQPLDRLKHLAARHRGGRDRHRMEDLRCHSKGGGDHRPDETEAAALRRCAAEDAPSPASPARSAPWSPAAFPSSRR